MLDRFIAILERVMPDLTQLGAIVLILALLAVCCGDVDWSAIADSNLDADAIAAQNLAP
ncbi:MAG: hypothetical protein K2X12_02645 [Burkholderiaceae bacterium]|jgi:hypothetical protein|nr:hypothetical protein [Burkholderiaceae bacterium]